MNLNHIYHGDALSILKTFPDQSVNCCVTSPPYWGLRDYGVIGQLGLEKTPEEFIDKMVVVFREVRRVLQDNGTLWCNIGDSYAAGGMGGQQQPDNGNNPFSFRGHRPRQGHRIPKKAPLGFKPKDLVGIPWMLAFALRADGWYLRQDIIWSKPNPMPESVTDRCTKAHEYIFLMSKSQRYYYDQDAIREPLTEGSLLRLGESNIENQRGSDRVPGKTNGPMKAVCKKSWHDHTEELQKGNRISEKLNHPLGANKRSVWTVPTMPYKKAHFATFPMALIRPCIIAGCPQGGVVLDPFIGSGTTAAVARSLLRNYVGIELNQKYITELCSKRLEQMSITEAITQKENQSL